MKAGKMIFKEKSSVRDCIESQKLEETSALWDDALTVTLL